MSTVKGVIAAVFWYRALRSDPWVRQAPRTAVTHGFGDPRVRHVSRTVVTHSRVGSGDPRVRAGARAGRTHLMRGTGTLVLLAATCTRGSQECMGLGLAAANQQAHTHGQQKPNGAHRGLN